MDEFIKLLNKDYELVHYQMKDKAIIFHIQSSRKELTCPFCGSKSMRTHSTYEREMQDLPIQEKQVILLVTTRKMFCDNPECQHTTFAEVHPFAAPKAQKTDRLVKNILHTSTQLSSLNASKLLKSGHITVCKSSICSLLKKMPAIVDKSSVTKVCVDDVVRQIKRGHIRQIKSGLIHVNCQKTVGLSSLISSDYKKKKLPMQIKTRKR